MHIQTYVAQKLQLPSYFTELELLGTFNDTRERDFSKISPVIENIFVYNFILIRYKKLGHIYITMVSLILPQCCSLISSIETFRVLESIAERGLLVPGETIFEVIAEGIRKQRFDFGANDLLERNGSFASFL